MEKILIKELFSLIYDGCIFGNVRHELNDASTNYGFWTGYVPGLKTRIVFTLSIALLLLPNCKVSAEPVPMLFSEPEVFEVAIASASDPVEELSGISGLIVPHHLLAADMISDAFLAASYSNYERIVLISPDSFRAASQNISVSGRSFETAFGSTRSDPFGEAILRRGFSGFDNTLFGSEHGLHAIFPFLVRYFPEVPVLSVVIKSDATQIELRELEEDLVNLTTENTLFVLSVDFSHFLPLERAVLRDQETLNLLSLGRMDFIRNLRETDHLDNSHGLLLMLRLQGSLGQQLHIIDNRNSQSYARHRVVETTSYITGVFHRPTVENSNLTSDICVSGDVFLGRGLDRYLETAEASDALANMVLGQIPDCPLIVNLEAVLTQEPVIGAPPSVLWAQRDKTVAFLKRIGVVGINLANNHSMDLGPDYYRSMVEHLREQGFTVLEHGIPTRLLGVTFVAITEGTKQSGKSVGADLTLTRLAQGGLQPPIVALTHWGEEWKTEPDSDQITLADRLRDLGVSAILGNHPHVASDGIRSDPAGRQISLYSMGNFLFDQTSPPASGKIVLLDTFEQGTYFVRVVSVPGFYSSLIGK